MERASGLGQGTEEPPPILRSTAVPADNAALPVHPLTTSALLELIAICCDVRGNAAPNLALRSRTERLVALHAARDRTNVANRLPNFGLHCWQASSPYFTHGNLQNLTNSTTVAVFFHLWKADPTHRPADFMSLLTLWSPQVLLLGRYSYAVRCILQRW